MARMRSSSGNCEALVSSGVIVADRKCDSQYVRSDLACGGAEKRAEGVHIRIRVV